MHPQSKVDGDGVVRGGEEVEGNNHTEEYWKVEGGRGVKSKADWVKEEEGLNRGHRASESFAVLNELVVVPSPTPKTPEGVKRRGLMVRIVDRIRF
jgi:hypothetical protein